jgi:hypothetical protein
VGIPYAYANNDSVRIAVDPVTFPTGVDNNRILRWSPPAPPEGYLPVSMGFEFDSKYQSQPLGIAVKYGPLPPGRKRSDVRIYRYSGGIWMLDRSPAANDSLQGYAGVTTGDITSPFMAMIDDRAPTVTVLSHPEKPVVNGEAVIDTFLISDNCGNAGWKFSFGKAGEGKGDFPEEIGTLAAASGVVVTVIPGALVSADQGVRAFFTVSDGTNEVTTNVSRRVIRASGGSDVVTVDPLRWVPLRVTAQLDSPDASRALRVLCGGGSWKYDNTKFRLFRWMPGEVSVEGGGGGYVEYSEARRELFAFEPGRLLWFKTRTTAVIDFGRGVTPALTRPTVIPLRARSWTDLALPFDFPISIGDIIDATAAAGGTTEGLRFCRWLKDSTRRYSAAELYAPRLGIKELKDASKVLESRQNDGAGAPYSVYNQSDSDVDLYIPPLPVVLSRYRGPAAGKAEAGSGGAIKIACRTAHGEELNDVYCVCRKGSLSRRYFPAAPSLGGGVDVRVCDERLRQFGHVIDSGAIDAQGGARFNLAFVNSSDRAEEVIVSVTAPPDLRPALFNPVTGRFTDDPAQWRIQAAPGATSYCQLYAGDDAFMAKARLEKTPLKAALAGVSIEPSRKSMRIRFVMPEQLAGGAAFALFDVRGRKIWTAAISAREGMSEIAWDGSGLGSRPAASGMYLLQMTVFDRAGAKAAVFNRHVTWMP